MKAAHDTINTALLLAVLNATALPAGDVFAVSGIVTDLGKQPVQGAILHCEYSNQSVSTGPDGSFFIEIGRSETSTRSAVPGDLPEKTYLKPCVSMSFGSSHEAITGYDIFGRSLRMGKGRNKCASQIILQTSKSVSRTRRSPIATRTLGNESTKGRHRVITVTLDSTTTLRSVPVTGADSIEIILPVGQKSIALLPESTPAAQQALIDRFTPKLDKIEVEYDSLGNVVHVKFLNHKESERTRLNDDDMKDLLTLHRLRSVWLEGQGVTDEGVAVLAKFPELVEVRFHYMNRLMPRVTADFVAPIAVHRDLRVLEIKHNFGSPLNAETSVHGLDGFPLLERLVLDNAAAGPEAVALIHKCPKVKTLQLHRTTMSDSDFQDVVDALPLLDTLWLRPIRNSMTENALNALEGHASLVEVGMNLDFKNFTSQTALAPFVSITTLKKFRFVDIENLQPAYQWFREQRPDVLICSWIYNCL